MPAATSLFKCVTWQEHVHCRHGHILALCDMTALDVLNRHVLQSTVLYSGMHMLNTACTINGLGPCTFICTHVQKSNDYPFANDTWTYRTGTRIPGTLVSALVVVLVIEMDSILSVVSSLHFCLLNVIFARPITYFVCNLSLPPYSTLLTVPKFPNCLSSTFHINGHDYPLTPDQYIAKVRRSHLHCQSYLSTDRFHVLMLCPGCAHFKAHQYVYVKKRTGVLQAHVQ